MGLDIAVGLLSELTGEDPEGAEYHAGVIAALNEVLAEAGLSPHLEPIDLSPEDTFSAQMWGCGGLHHLRRLAAYMTLEKRLPPPCRYEEASADPVLARFYPMHDRLLEGAVQPSVFGRLLGKQPSKIPFAHLILHSDAEGFYLPRELDAVVLDWANPQRTGVGGLIGSSISLLEECRILAEALALPDGIDPEAEEVWENAESPPQSGEAWQRYGVETFVLTRLLRACTLSQRTGAAVVFN